MHFYCLFQITPILGILLIIGGAMTIVFLAISAYFCVRKNNDGGNPPASSALRASSSPAAAGNSASANASANAVNTSTTSRGGGKTPSYTVGYSVTNNGGSVVITDAKDMECGNPDVVPNHSTGN